MGLPKASCAQPHEQTVIITSGLIDFILHRMKSKGLSKRQLAVETGIGRTRMITCLKETQDKRRPFRVDEIDLILQILEINEVEAFLASEMLSNSDRAFEMATGDADRLIGFLSEFIQGLPEVVIDLVHRLEGLEWSDIQPAYGRRLQSTLVKFLKKEFESAVALKEQAFNRRYL